MLRFTSAERPALQGRLPSYGRACQDPPSIPIPFELDDLSCIRRPERAYLADVDAVNDVFEFYDNEVQARATEGAILPTYTRQAPEPPKTWKDSLRTYAPLYIMSIIVVALVGGITGGAIRGKWNNGSNTGHNATHPNSI